jgi:hypothetical protein
LRTGLEKARAQSIGVMGRIILKWILKAQDVRMWTGFMTQCRVQWQALVNMVNNFQVL